jgi:hypothetical protein
MFRSRLLADTTRRDHDQSPARSGILALSLFPTNLSDFHGKLRFHDEPRGQDRPAQAPHPQGHLAFLLPRRQDRRARPERLGQVDAAQDHGRHRQGHRRRSHPAAEPEHRLPAAGTAARSGADRAPVGRIGPRRSLRSASQARRCLCRLRRTGRRFRPARRRAGAPGSNHRRLRRQHAQPAIGNGRRRAAPAAVGRQDRRAVGR